MLLLEFEPRCMHCVGETRTNFCWLLVLLGSEYVFPVPVLDSAAFYGAQPSALESEIRNQYVSARYVRYELPLPKSFSKAS